MTNWTHRAGLMLAAITLVIATGTARAREDLPRYRLEPGMELTYKGSDTFKHQNGMHLSEIEGTAWVVRRNANGSVRIVLRQGSRLRQTSAADSLKSLLKTLILPPMEYQVGTFDLFPDGRIGPDSELGYQIDPALYFPRLPDEVQARTTWNSRDDKMAKECQYASFHTEPGGWAFVSDLLGPEKTIYGMSIKETFHFDAARGVIGRIDVTSTQAYGFKGKGTGTVELTALSRKDATWLAAFGPAADRYFAANRAYDRATEDAMKDADRAVAMLDDARAALKSARDAIDEPTFRERLDLQLKKHDALATYAADAAIRRGEVVGKPAADWSLAGLDGKTHALGDYRGKVVVLDFWYRGCGWCIRAMPQINALAEQFEGRPVVVLGMNTDSDEADAKFVVDAMGLKYGTLRAKGIPEKYGVEGFPTLILIDAEGKVRDIHVGYRPTLRADVAKAIEGLLPTKP